MKNITLLFLAITFFSGCKKGEEDPFLSLRSRKARVVGEWTSSSISSATSYIKEYPDNLDKDNELRTLLVEEELINEGNTINVTLDGTMIYDDASQSTELIKTANGSTYARTTSELAKEESGIYEPVLSYSVTFNKDNTFSVVKQITHTFSTTDNTNTRYDRTLKIEQIQDMTYTGSWEFLEKEGEFKNKERIRLSVSAINFIETRRNSILYTDKNTEDDINWSDFNTIDEDKWTGSVLTPGVVSEEVWELVMLKNKEVKANITSEFSYDATYINKSTVSGNTTTSDIINVAATKVSTQDIIMLIQ